MRPALRRFLWLAHRWVGLACAVVFVVTAATGFFLMFDRELNLRAAAALARPSLGLSGLNRGLDLAAAAELGFVPVLLRPPSDRSHAWVVFLNPRSGAAGPRLAIGIDPDSGAVLSDGKYMATPAGFIISLHMELLSGPVGRAVMLLVSIELTFLALSGFLILNRRLRILAANPLNARDRWRAVHRWSGLIGAALIPVWSITAFLMLGPSVLGDINGPPKPVPIARAALDAGLDMALTQPAVAREGEVFEVTPPTQMSPNLRVKILRRSAPPWSKFVTLELDARSGAVIKRTPPDGMPAADRLLSTYQSLHMGQYDAWPIHRAYQFAAVFPLLIVLTGSGAWIGRKLSERKRKRTPAMRRIAGAR